MSMIKSFTRPAALVASVAALMAVGCFFVVSMLRESPRAPMPEGRRGGAHHGAEVAETPVAAAAPDVLASQAQGLLTKEGPKLIETNSDFDLLKYPRGLRAHIEEAIHTRNGRLAFEMARVVGRCLYVEARMNGLQELMSTERDIVMNRYHAASYRAEQQLQSQCQTVDQGAGSIRETLLRIALEGGIESSAAELFGSFRVSDPRIIAALVRDAANGDLHSVAALTTILRPNAQVPSIEVDKARFVLLLAAEQPALRRDWAPYLDLARRAGFPDWPQLGNYPAPLERKYQATILAKTDVVSQAEAGLDEEAKKEAQQTLQRILQREELGKRRS
ncbi:hypothetical protein J7U46_14790 [Pelomonas sp. V22]|uniref:hypothetical protein n=1 Tax=Pelomonas sp. V22 TaxID=2822139 RepID=UPI0024A940A3|nr:hypothetical protein [Pelomonas sp. V22]MDI4634323.1 hypothetical protein [Pelomonas sp. V22]